MNQVHEQCPKIDSGTVPGRKQVECTECTALASPHAQAVRLRRPARLPPACACLRAPAHTRAVPYRLLRVLPRADCAARSRARALRARAPRACMPARPTASRARPRAPRAPSAPCCAQRLPNQHCLLQYTTVYYNTKISPSSPFLSQYSELYCDTICLSTN